MVIVIFHKVSYLGAFAINVLVNVACAPLLSQRSELPVIIYLNSSEEK